jgi:DNA-binding transcriptional LysR family regulator
VRRTGLSGAFRHACHLDDLHAHRCIPIRERDQDFGRWELDGPEGRVAIKVSGPLSANNGEIVRQWAIDGHGIILRSTWDAAREIEAGQLVQVLPAYSQQPTCGRCIRPACPVGQGQGMRGVSGGLVCADGDE